MMQNSCWSHIDIKGYTNQQFSIDNNVAMESKKTIYLQSVSLMMASLAYKTLEELHSAGATMQEIANTMKENYELKYGNVWHCILGDAVPIIKNKGENIIIKSGDCFVTIFRTSQSTAIEIFDGIDKIKIVENKTTMQNAVDNWLEQFCNKNNSQELHDADDQAMIDYVINWIAFSIGENWSFNCSKSPVEIVTFTESIKRFKLALSNNLRIDIFKTAHIQSLNVDHSTCAAILHYASAIFNVDKLAPKLLLSGKD